LTTHRHLTEEQIGTAAVLLTIMDCYRAGSENLWHVYP